MEMPKITMYTVTTMIWVYPEGNYIEKAQSFASKELATKAFKHAVEEQREDGKNEEADAKEELPTYEFEETLRDDFYHCKGWEWEAEVTMTSAEVPIDADNFRSIGYEWQERDCRMTIQEMFENEYSKYARVPKETQEEILNCGYLATRFERAEADNDMFGDCCDTVAEQVMKELIEEYADDDFDLDADDDNEDNFDDGDEDDDNFDDDDDFAE